MLNLLLKKQYKVNNNINKNINNNDTNNISNENAQFTISDQLFLETLLLMIRGEIIKYSSRKKKENTLEKIKLEEEAFDFVSWKCVLNTLEYFNFGSSIK